MDVRRELEEEMMAEQQISESGGQQQAPMDINSQAQTEAQRMLSMPYEYRVQALRQLEAMNPTLYAMVKNIMDKTRSAAKSQQGYENLAAAGMAGHQMPPG